MTGMLLSTLYTRKQHIIVKYQHFDIKSPCKLNKLNLNKECSLLSHFLVNNNIYNITGLHTGREY